MTTKELVDLIAGYRWFVDEKIRIVPEDILIAGTFAQRDICRFGYLLEMTATLGLSPKQERYTFKPTPITAVTAGSPAILNIPHHPYHLGDDVFIAGAEGVTGLNGRYKISATTLDSITLKDSTVTGTYTGNGYVYHTLLSALQIKGHINKLSDGGVITKRDKFQVDEMRHHFGTSSPGSKVLYFYEVHGQQLEVGFQGIPATPMTVEIMFFRKPQGFEKLSLESDPILPDDYDKLLYAGTLYHLLDMTPHPKAVNETERWQLTFFRDLVAHGGSAVKQRVSYYLRTSNLEWKS